MEVYLIFFFFFTNEMQANELCLVGLHMCTMQNMLENCEKLMRNRGDGRSFLIKLCVQLYVK